jgi:hypothetical protein
MAITIVQKPYSKFGPAGQDWVWTLSSTNLAGNYKFKFIADLYIYSGSTPPATYTIRLKFSPNELGRGIVNLHEILTQHVSSDNLCSSDFTITPEFKGTAPSFLYGNATPIHVIDKWSLSTNTIKRVDIQFGEEYSSLPTSEIGIYPNKIGDRDYAFWNAVIGENVQNFSGGKWGLELQATNTKDKYRPFGPMILNQNVAQLLTDAPTGTPSDWEEQMKIGQFVRDGDYHTLGFLAGGTDAGNNVWERALVMMYPVASGFYIDATAANGGYDGSLDTSLTDAVKHVQFLGCGPGNLINNAFFSAQWPTTTHYVVYAYGNGADHTYVSKGYIFNKQEDDCKGFDTIRLTWLNRWGAWDYYNFTKKSYREIDIDRTEYNSVRGEWGGSRYIRAGFSRGKSVLNSTATETIRANSDWVRTDEEATWLEQLFISPEVYILESFETTDGSQPDVGRYTTPVIVKSDKYEKYTKANDKVAQYEIEIQVGYNINTQQG